MTIKDDVILAHNEHPEWTARQIAEHLNIQRYHVYNNAKAARLTLATAPLPISANKTSIAVVEPAVTPPVDFTVYANNPADMVGAQRSMVEWCAGKIDAERFELAEAERNLQAAHDHNWTGTGWDRQVKLIGKKIDFYTKMMGALESGYYIVPPFPIDIFAIRTNRKTPDKKTTTWRGDLHTQEAQLLPAGEGRYVSDQPEIYQRDVPGAATKDNKPTTVTEYFGENFQDVDFPFKLAKGEIMSATRAAMALRVFDQMGALPTHRSPDPIICGQILMPHRRGQAVTFFVSWWLDTKTL